MMDFYFLKESSMIHWPAPVVELLGYIRFDEIQTRPPLAEGDISSVPSLVELRGGRVERRGGCKP